MIAVANRQFIYFDNNIRAGSYSECKDAGLVVITAGVSQKEGETRIDLLNRNASILKSITTQIMATGFNGIIVVASNPVDILSYVVWKESLLGVRRYVLQGQGLPTKLYCVKWGKNK